MPGSGRRTGGVPVLRGEVRGREGQQAGGQMGGRTDMWGEDWTQARAWPCPQLPAENLLPPAAARQRHLAAGAAGREQRHAGLPLPLRRLQLPAGGRLGGASAWAGPGGGGRSWWPHASSLKGLDPSGPGGFPGRPQPSMWAAYAGRSAAVVPEPPQRIRAAAQGPAGRGACGPRRSPAQSRLAPPCPPPPTPCCRGSASTGPSPPPHVNPQEGAGY